MINITIDIGNRSHHISSKTVFGRALKDEVLEIFGIFTFYHFFITHYNYIGLKVCKIGSIFKNSNRHTDKKESIPIQTF
jgi:hypothetical protein